MNNYLKKKIFYYPYFKYSFIVSKNKINMMIKGQKKRENNK